MSLKNSSVIIKNPKLFKNKLNNNKIFEIYKKFENSLNTQDDFAVAVSGGPDSLALAFLAKVYSIKKKVKAKFLIVDHKIRSESSKEASFVKKILKKFSIHAKILVWKGKKPIKNIQSLARKKRYELLFAECDKFEISHVLLGHHQDDLFENFFIRLLRGSGLKGLISLDKKNKINGKNLLRPLLNIKKEDLIYISKHVFNYYVKDPSNDDEKFQRIRIRNLLNELQKNGLDKKKLFETIKNLKQSDYVVNFYVIENLRNNTLYSKKKNQIILNGKFFKQPYEITFRAFSDTIRKIGKKYYSARGKKLDRIINQIINGTFYKATLGGCIIKKVSQTVIISKEH